MSTSLSFLSPYLFILLAPHGSSTGSAVGVSAGFGLLAIGEETDGSIISPAARAALYSLKLSRNSVDMDGVLRISRTYDIVGGMARSPADLAVISEVLLNDTARAKVPVGGYSSALTTTWNGLRVGFLNENIWMLVEGVCKRDPAILAQTVSSVKTK